MGRASRTKRLRKTRVAEMQWSHDNGELVCTNCRREISPNELSFSCDWDGGLVVSCYGCAPGLMEVLDMGVFGGGTRFQDGWRRHCAGEVDCFEGYRMRGA